MADLTISATVTRADVPGGPLADLAFDVNSTYELVDVDRGATTKRRVVATSPFIDGGANAGSVKDMSALTLTIRVLGATLADVDAAVAALRTAFDQASYQVSITIDGATETYDCWDYDAEQPVDSSWNKYGLMAHRQTYRFVLPRQPNPAAGNL